MESNSKQTVDFEQEMKRAGRGGILGELWGFLKHTKKWWLLPIVLVFLFVGALVILAGTGAAPFIYTLF
jgi:hypothetical protein